MIEIFYGVYIFIIGLLLGSFYNVCIYRIPREESVAFPASHCTNCGTSLKGLDLVPVLSYVFLKGQCRYCKEKISPRYAIVELSTAIIFLSIYLVYGFNIEMLKFLVLASFMIVIGMIDYDTTDVYTITIIIGIISGIVLVIIGYYLNNGEIITYILGGVISGGVITIIIVVTGGMGWGDAEIALLCGIYLGLANSILFLILSFILGGILGLLLILTKIKSRKDYIPFGPFMAIAAINTIIFGDEIIKWYLTAML